MAMTFCCAFEHGAHVDLTRLGYILGDDELGHVVLGGLSEMMFFCVTAAAVESPLTKAAAWFRTDRLPADGALVRFLADDSGSGTHARGVTGVKKPTRVASKSFPGAPTVLRFSGEAEQVLRFELPEPLAGKAELTIFIVAGGSGRGCSHRFSSKVEGRPVDPGNADVDTLLRCESTADWGGVGVAPFPDRLFSRLGLGGPFGAGEFVNRVGLEHGSAPAVLSIVKDGAHEEMFVNGATVFTAERRSPTVLGTGSTCFIGGRNSELDFPSCFAVHSSEPTSSPGPRSRARV